jgi:hypothetical protein
MSMTTILIIVLVVLLLGGGGYSYSAGARLQSVTRARSTLFAGFLRPSRDDPKRSIWQRPLKQGFCGWRSHPE